jgi:cbb3-type cytochrome oxidase maturation protein
MEVIYILLPLAVLLAAAALIAFIRAVGAGQFDDLETPPHRILYDDESELPKLPEAAPIPDRPLPAASGHNDRR